MASPVTICREEYTCDSSSYVDPHGFVFHYNGEIYRFIRSEAATRFESLIKDGTLAQLEAEHGLVPTRRSDLRLADEADGIVVQHDRITPLTYCVEWCPSMLRDAARTTLGLALSLVDRDLMLQDAYPWNILFSGSKPIFVDLTSIVPVDASAIWPAQDQFEAFFLRPLVLAADGKGRAAGAMLFDNITGISGDDFSHLISPFYRWRHPSLAVGRWLDKRLQKSAKMKERVRRTAEKAGVYVTPSVRKRFMKGLMKRLDALRVQRTGDPWAKYYAEVSPTVDKRAKLNAVRSLLDKLRADTVLDLGCNTGVFSLEAARLGARVVSIDSSESCIELLYNAARTQDMPITPLIGNILCPSPQFGFMGTQYPSMLQRVQSDVVLCLGLMHHLHLTGRQSFDRIAQLVHTVSKRCLIFEFIAIDDENAPHLPVRREIAYTLDTVVLALKKYFKKIDIQPSDRKSRKLLICQK